ncbi:ATP-binding protein [Bdellovibrionota bacterium FG-1]
MSLDVRYLEKVLLEDPLKTGKMAFVSGPRQCGKTTLAERLLNQWGCPENYFSWDDPTFQRMWTRSPSDLLTHLTITSDQTPLVVLDELHKHKKWKNSLKGLYDLHKNRLRLLVTGSARLNIYRKAGDSLVGRYIPYHLHPFTYGETDRIKPPPSDGWHGVAAFQPRFDFQSLLTLGGFPEPLLQGSAQKAARWWRLYREQLIREDLRDLKAIRDLQTLSLMVTFLLEKVGGGFSFQSLQEDLSVSFATIQDWISALESIFLCFLIRPYSKRIQGSLKKEPKVFFYHWAALSSPGARLENLVACHLLKSIHAWTDSAEGEFELFYLRDKQKREVDFCVTRDKKPWLLLEVKNRSRDLSPALAHFTEILSPQFAIQLQEPGMPRREQYTWTGKKVLFLAVDEFLAELN